MMTKLKSTKIVNFITTRYEVFVPRCGHIDDFMKMIDFVRILYSIPGHRENMCKVCDLGEEMSIVRDSV